MRDLYPIASLYKKHFWSLSFGVLLAFITAIASISLLTLSGWFITASSVAGLLAIANFNYMLPAAGVRGFSILRTFGRWSERVVGHEATFKLLATLRVFFFKKLLPLSPSNKQDLRDGEIANRITADVDAMDHLYLRLLSPLITGFLGIASITFFLAWFDLSLALTLGAILLALLCIIPAIFYRLGKPYGIALAKSKANLRISMLDWLTGFAEFEIYGASKRFRNNIVEKEQAFLHTQLQMAKITGFANAFFLLASGLTLIFMLYLAADGIAGQSPNPLVALVIFATLASFELLTPIAGAFQFLSNSMHSAKRLNEIIQAKPEVVFSTENTIIDAYNIEIKNLDFKYKNASDLALNRINLSIAEGEKVALLGSTGCGKSTLINLLTRTYDATHGDIFIGTKALKTLSENTLCSSICVVTQRVDIFNGSLRHNLKIAKNTATDEELIQALHDVELAKLLDGQGLDTWLGDGGRVLSGGERRRIGIARAILHDAPIFLLDEPTEGLDSQTEKQMLSLLFSKTKNKTVLFITHRLAGLSFMDKVCYMEEGSIMGFDTAFALYEQNKAYQTFIQSVSP